MSNFLQFDLTTKNKKVMKGRVESSILKLGPSIPMSKIINMMELIPIAPANVISLLGVFWKMVERNKSMPTKGKMVNGCNTDMGFNFAFMYNS